MSTYYHFIYPVVVETTESNYSLYFPDFPGTAILDDDISTCIREAKDMLAFRILELEEKGLEMPTPSNPESIKLFDSTDRIVFIDIYMPPYRNESANKAVTKNCTLPRWLRDAGESAGLNFSQLLQTAIKEALNINTNNQE